MSIRRTAFRYALRSEASLRFEKGQEHRLARLGADRTAQLILRWAGGRAARGVVDTDPVDPEPIRIPFRPARVSRLLGVDLPPDEQTALLARVEVDGAAGHGDRCRADRRGRGADRTSTRPAPARRSSRSSRATGAIS